MSTTLYRGPLTDALLEELVNLGKPVGDGQRPKAGGWQGQPNAVGSTFTPYLVLGAGSSMRSSGSMGHPQSEWQINYLIQAYGTKRDQCEWMADRARDALAGMRGSALTLGPDNFKVQQVWTQSIGSVTPSNATDPPIWSQQDQVVVWLSQEVSS